ncbi:MAG TPA: site-specific integrase, partial [Anaerolineae bacterium]|nr:site-specific integrase [Anaerolineae bacterium]
METTDFAKSLSAFLTKYLAGERNYSINTVLAYKDTFVQFITFMKEQKNVAVQKLSLECITKDVVIDFLDWIQENRHC